ncbi:MAG TPA: NFACT RNA binding domain-containing protein [Chloroflexota bacterium]|nr:NFACT RNA binding domain-containing protein [Chloroflexota bacterium]
MPYDTLTLACVVDEARATLIGSRIQRIVQPSEHAVALSAYGNHQTSWALLSADPRYARFVLSRDRFAKAFDTPSPFVMLLRKHLEGGHIDDIHQAPGERIAALEVVAGPRQVELLIEIMGRHSNIILLDGGQILGAVKHITPRQSRVRTILPGRKYERPPIQPPGPISRVSERIDPAVNPAAVRAALATIPSKTPVVEALLGLLTGISPFLAVQIVRAAGLAPEALIGQANLDRIVEAAARFYELAAKHDWSPTTFVNDRNRVDFAPYSPLGMSNVRRTESMSAAIEEAVGADESRDVLAASRRRLLTEIDRRRHTVARRLHSLREALSATEGTQEVMERGQLLLAYQYLPRDPDSLTIPDLDRTIPLRRELTVQENAEHLFKRYRKLRDAAKRVPGLLAAAEREEAQLIDLAAFVTLAESEADLRELARQLHPEQASKKARTKAAPVKRGPRRLEMDGYVVILGRNARENEEVTFSESRRDDLWLHARGRTGAHVLLRPGTAPENVVTAAAALAAYHSEGRSDSAVDVDVTAARNVRRIPGGPPGRVTYRDFRTVRVKPDLGSWRPG